jgi:hypothetical protein
MYTLIRSVYTYMCHVALLRKSIVFRETKNSTLMEGDVVYSTRLHGVKSYNTKLFNNIP